MSYTHEIRCVASWLRLRSYGDPVKDKVSSDGRYLHHYGATLAMWVQGEFCLHPILSFTKPSEARLRLLREVVRASGIPDFELGLLEERDGRGSRTWPVRYYTLNGERIDARNVHTVSLATGLTALALRAKFNHPIEETAEEIANLD